MDFDFTTLTKVNKEDYILRCIFENYAIQNKIPKILTPDLFSEFENKVLVKEIQSYIDQFNRFPQAKDLYLRMADANVAKDKIVKIMQAKIGTLLPDQIKADVQAFVREKRTMAILMKAGEMHYEEKISEIGQLTKELEEAVNFSLDLTVGLHSIKDTEEILRRLNETQAAIPSSLAWIRTVTGSIRNSGGFYRKAISLFLGETNIGKTIFLCNEATYAARAGFNVLYVTFELAEELIFQRIYSNLTDIEYQNVPGGTADGIRDLIDKNKLPGCEVAGHIIVKKLPTTSTVDDIDNVINEINIQYGIEVDLLVLDYIGIMKPKKSKGVSLGNHNTYTMGKDVTEQVRDLLNARNMAGLSAVQFNREGYGDTKASLKNIADSAGVGHTADFMASITQDPILKSKNLFMQVVLKNRFGPKDSVFLVKCDYSHMRITDATNEDQMEYNNAQMSQEAKVPSFQHGKVDTSAGNNIKKDNPKTKEIIPLEKQEFKVELFDFDTVPVPIGILNSSNLYKESNDPFGDMVLPYIK